MNNTCLGFAGEREKEGKKERKKERKKDSWSESVDGVGSLVFE